MLQHCDILTDMDAISHPKRKRQLEVADLYEEPLDRFGEDAVERWFSEEEVDELMEVTGQFAA